MGIVIENVHAFQSADNGLCYIFFTELAKFAGFEARRFHVSSKTAHPYLVRNRMVIQLWNPCCYESISNHELRVLQVIHSRILPPLSKAICMDDPSTTHGEFWTDDIRKGLKTFKPDSVVPTPTTLYGVTSMTTHCLSWGLQLGDGRIRFLSPQEIAMALALPPCLHFRSLAEIPNVRYDNKTGDRGEIGRIANTGTGNVYATASFVLRFMVAAYTKSLCVTSLCFSKGLQQLLACGTLGLPVWLWSLRFLSLLGVFNHL